MITFPDLVDTARNTAVRSEQNTMFETGTLAISAKEPQGAQVSIVKNGAYAGTSTSVNVLDTIALEVITSSQFSDTIHVAYTFAGETGLWSVTTARDLAFYVNPERARLSVYDHAADDDGISVVYLPARNAMHILPQVGGEIEHTTSLNVNVESAELLLADRIVCSFHDRRLLLLGADGKQVLRTIEVPGKPHSVAQLGSLVLVTMFERDEVIALDTSGNITHAIPVGKAPAGIFASVSAGTVVVCNTGDNTISKISMVGSDLMVTGTIPVGAYPLYGISALGADWVSCSGSNTVCKIEGTNVTPVVVGNAPKQMYASGQKLFVACLGEDKVYVIEGGQTTGTISTERCPYSIAGSGPNRIAVTCLGSKSVIDLDTNSGLVLARSEFERWPMFTRLSGSKIRVLEMWGMTPDYLHQRDTDPHPFVFDASDQVIPGKVIVTNTFTVVGLNTQVPARVAPVSNTRIIKNGSDVGVSTVVDSGDVIGLTLAAPAQHDVDFKARLSIGAQSTTWNCRTRVVDDVIDSFRLPSVQNAELQTEYTSATVTISGLDEGVEVLAECTGGRLFVNDAEMLSAAMVKNGDTIHIVMVSAAEYHTMQTAVLEIGSFQEAWTIVTKPSLTPAYLQPASDAGKTIPTLLNFPAWLPRDVDTTKNKVLRYDKTTLQKKAEYSLTATPAENGLSDAPRLYAIDAYAGKLIVVDYADPTKPGVERVYTPGGIPYCVAAGPAVAMSHQPTSNYYTVLGSNRIRKIGSAQEVLMQAGSKPMGIVVSNYNQMYVADDNGLVHIYNYDEHNDTFVLDTIFAIPGGGRLQDFVVDDSTIYVTDITNSCVHILRNGLYYGYVDVDLLPYSIAQSGTQVFTANFGNGTISSFRKEDGQTTSTTLQLPDEASQPLGLTYDSTTGRLFVACSRSEKVYVIRVSDMQITDMIPTGPCWGVQVIQGDLYVVTLWGNMLRDRNVGFMRANPISLTFAGMTDAELETQCSRQAKLTEYFVRPEPAYIEPIDGAVLLKNGIAVSSGTLFTTNDTLTLGVTSRPDYDKDRTIGILCGQRYSEFLVHTMHDEFPDRIVFPSVQRVIPKDYVHSETRTVSGIEPGLSVKSHARYSEADSNAFIEIYLNGELVEDNDEFYVTNDDTLRISFKTTNLKWNGKTVDVQLYNSRGFSFAVFTAYSGYLDYAIWYPTDTDMMDGMDGREYAPNNAWLTGAPEPGTIITKNDVGVRDVYVPELLHQSSFESVAKDATASMRTFSYSGEADWIPISLKHVMLVSDEMLGYMAQTYAYFAGAPEGMFAQKLPRESLGYSFDGAEVQSHKSWAIHAIDAGGWDSKGRAQTSTLGANYENLGRAQTSLYDTEQNWKKLVCTKPLVFWTTWRDQTRPLPATYAVDYADNTDRSQKISLEKEYANHSNGIVFFNAGYTGRGRIHSPWFSTSYDDRQRPSEVAYNASYKDAFRDKPKALHEATYTGMTLLGSYAVQSLDWLRKLARSHNVSGGATYSGQVRVDPKAVDRPTTIRHRSRRPNTATPAGYSVPEIIVFDEFIYTPTQIRAYPNPAEAYAAGVASLHPVVFTKELWDSTWMWDVPAEVERVDCGNTAMLQRYLRGYVQGG